MGGNDIREKDFLVLLINYRDVYRRQGLGGRGVGGFFVERRPKISQAKKLQRKGGRQGRFFNIFLLFGKSAKRIDYSRPKLSTPQKSAELFFRSERYRTFSTATEMRVWFENSVFPPPSLSLASVGFLKSQK